MWFGQGAENRSSGATSRLGVESTSRSMQARPGHQWDWRKRGVLETSTSILAIRKSYWHARWDTPMVRSRNAAFSAQPMAEKVGRRCCLSTRTRVARIWLWTQTIRAFCLRGCGKSRSILTAGRAEDQAADYSSPATAAQLGNV